ncbi:FAD-linked oxidoreductase pyvE [Cladobotryum mycophilum]|uniref:FAD-linked oxidoreductase pyvE n=1 Tax=Cladobotryum mycophilum TaxID=491253 RepID=A0ABR0SC88_9HYPO
MASVDFAELKSELKSSTLLLPSDEGYDQSIKRWSEGAVRKAAAVALVQSSEDISIAVKFAVKHNVEVAVHGGGHATSGSSSVEGGLVIDLSRMRGVTVDPATKTVLVQGGALWSDVDAATADHGLAVVAGTVNHTGVGGLTLGGGFGWLSSKHGLTVDNLNYVTMVLADGRIVTASPDENPDLFWAVRGAGSSFGVAVDFSFRAHPAPKVYTAGFLVFTLDKLDEVVDFVNYFHKELLDENCAMFFGMSAPPPAKTPLVLTPITFNGTKAEAEEKYAKLLALGPVMNSVTEMPYHELNGFLNKGLEHGNRRATHGSSVEMPLDKGLIHQVRDSFAQFVKDNENTNESIILFEITYQNKVCEVPLTETATVMRTQNMNAGILTKWYDSSLDTAVRDWARGLGKLIKEVGNPNSSYTAYANYSYLESRSRDLFGVNYDRLVELKKKYDPENVFHSWHDLSGKQDEKQFSS